MFKLFEPSLEELVDNFPWKGFEVKIARDDKDGDWYALYSCEAYDHSDYYELEGEGATLKEALKDFYRRNNGRR